MGLFDERIAYKPFEYPEYYTEGWLKQAQAFWLHTEISMQSDIKDWNEKLNEKEKHLVGNILLGFAQTECAVSDYWTQNVVSWFPKHEIKQMAMMFGSHTPSTNRLSCPDLFLGYLSHSSMMILVTPIDLNSCAMLIIEPIVA